MAKYEGMVVWDSGANERTGPGTNFPNTGITFALGDMVSGNLIQPDALDPTNDKKEWLQLENGKWVATKYPNTAGDKWIRVDYHEVAPPAQSVFVTIDITADVDGRQYGAVVPNIELLPK